MNNLFLSTNQHRILPHHSFESESKKENIVKIKKIVANTVNSLNEVEYFLNNFQKLKKYIRLYKIFK